MRPNRGPPSQTSIPEGLSHKPDFSVHIRAKPPVLDYEALCAQMRAEPEALAQWVCCRLVDDDMRAFAAELAEYFAGAPRGE